MRDEFKGWVSRQQSVCLAEQLQKPVRKREHLIPRDVLLPRDGLLLKLANTLSGDELLPPLESVVEHSSPEGLGMTCADEWNEGWIVGGWSECCGIVGGGDERGRRSLDRSGTFIT